MLCTYIYRELLTVTAGVVLPAPLLAGEMAPVTEPPELTAESPVRELEGDLLAMLLPLWCSGEVEVSPPPPLPVSFSPLLTPSASWCLEINRQDEYVYP